MKNVLLFCSRRRFLPPPPWELMTEKSWQKEILKIVKVLEEEGPEITEENILIALRARHQAREFCLARDAVELS